MGNDKVAEVKPRIRLAGEDRAREVVLAAYRLIAEKGLEGLRTREVASACGINPATLHYYFPTKEALIQGVVDYLIEEFQKPAADRPQSADVLEELKFEFADLSARRRAAGDTFIVLAELSLRAFRDPAIAEILTRMVTGWREYLTDLLQRGIREGVFRDDLDVAQEAEEIMIRLTGTTGQRTFSDEAMGRHYEIVMQETVRRLT